jgi:hypothetical protein
MADTVPEKEPDVLELELPYDLWVLLDEYAGQSNITRQTIIAEALRAYLGDAG